MSSFNKWIGMGNLTRDPELRYTPANMAICKIGMALNSKHKDKQSGEWIEKVTFVDVTIFGNRAESFEKYHKKGSMAFIEGRLELDVWDDKNSGVKRQKLYVVCENWEFVSTGDRQPGGSGEQYGANKKAGAQENMYGDETAGGYADDAGGGYPA